MSLRNPLPGRDKASKRVNTLTEKRLNAAYGTHRFGGRLSEAARGSARWPITCDGGSERPGHYFSMCHDPSQSCGGGSALKSSIRLSRAIDGPSPGIASSDASSARSASSHRRSR